MKTRYQIYKVPCPEFTSRFVYQARYESHPPYMWFDIEDPRGHPAQWRTFDDAMSGCRDHQGGKTFGIEWEGDPSK